MVSRRLIMEELDATLPQQMLDYPLTRQSKDFSCGTAVLQSILHYFGVDDVREDEVIDAVGANSEDGTDVESMLNYLQENGLRAKEVQNCSIDAVKRWLDRKQPVIISLQAWSNEEKPDYTQNRDSHYVVAIGYNDSSMFFEDPSLLGNRGILPINEFEMRWHDGGADRRAIFIAGGQPKYNSKVAKRIE